MIWHKPQSTYITEYCSDNVEINAAKEDAGWFGGMSGVFSLAIFSIFVVEIKYRDVRKVQEK